MSLIVVSGGVVHGDLAAEIVRLESLVADLRGVTREHYWVKLHFMCGVVTNVVTAVAIRDRDAQDAPLWSELLDATGRNFRMREVSGDKGYSSVRNIEAAYANGAIPYIPHKSHHSGKASGLWARSYHFFHLHRDEFLERYHKRSNAETTVSMIKGKFGDHVRSKTEVAMTNEVFCKVLAHNICCLIQAHYELGIDPRDTGLLQG
jgi:transposase